MTDASPDEPASRQQETIQPETRQQETPQPQTRQERAQDAFQVISRQARDSNLRRVDELDELATHAVRMPMSPEQRSRGRHLSHTLLGSAGTFGFVAATEPARQLEALFEGELGPHEAAAVSALLVRVRSALVAGPTEDDD